MLIDTGWRFNKGDAPGAQNVNFDDSGWPAVTLPHTWNNLDGQDGGSNYYRGIGWYRLHYTVPLAASGRELFLQFDGANLVADVYVNGTFVGEHQGGYTIFRFDVTAFMNVGAQNVIAVKVNNAFNANITPLTSDYTFFGGIYRDVHLIATNKLHIQELDYGGPGIYLQQTDVGAASANLHVTIKVQNDYTATLPATLTTLIVDAAGNVVQMLTTTQRLSATSAYTAVQSTTITNPHLWNGLADPYLYTAYVEVLTGSMVTDLVSQPLGFRYFSVDPNRGFFLNGHYLDLHGVALHQDMFNMGWAVTDTQRDQDFSFVQELGATSIRLSAYPRAQQMYDLGDQNGILIWAEIPLKNYITASAAFSSSAEQQLVELIRQNFNHPSIYCWGLANEITNQPGPDPTPLLARLNSLAHAEDPTRLTVIAGSTIVPPGSPTNWQADLTTFNKYLGWSSGSYNDIGAWADSIHASYPITPVGVSEFGAGAGSAIHSDVPVQGDFSEEYQDLFHEAYWQALEVRPFIWCKYVWNLFDFASDAHSEADTPGRNSMGLVTYDRQTRKDAFYWYKANWSSQPVVYITARRYTRRTQPNVTIKVYSNLPTLQLLINGVSLGSQTSGNKIFLWPGVVLANGNNVVQAIGTQNGVTTRDTVTWTLTSPPAGWALQATPTTNTLRGITCISAAVCTAAGDLGTFVTTSSGGSSWSLQGAWTFQPTGQVALTPTLFGVACTGGGLCNAVGISGTILVTSNYGVGWPGQQSRTASSLYGLTCPAAGRCYAVGSNGAIQFTVNHGITWTSQTSTTHNPLTGIACPTLARCYAVGGLGWIGATRDGATWMQQTTPISPFLHAVACTSATACVAVGDKGAILVTANGGASWTGQPSGTIAALKGVACTTDGACIAVGDDGTILRRAAGSASWSPQASNTTVNLRGIACPGTTCFAVGDTGVVLANTSEG